MRYILKRDLFLDQNKINEVFQNQVTWGGSLIGRLINSTIRRSKIKKDSETIETVIKGIQSTLDRILQESINKDLRVKLYRLKLKKMVSDIKDVSLSNEKDWVEEDCEGTFTNSKLYKLIGRNIDREDADFNDKWKNLPSGCLIQNLFEEIERYRELKKLFTKDEFNKLVDVHSDFAVSLRRYRWENCNREKNAGGLKGIQIEYKGKNVVPESDKSLEKEIAVKSNEKFKYNLLSNFSEFNSIRLYTEATTGGSTSPTGSPTTGLPTTSTTTTGTSTTSTTTVTAETTKEPETVASIWKKYFLTTEPLSAFRLTQNDEKELQDLENKLGTSASVGGFTLDFTLASDLIVELFDQLNIAYQLFATEMIPSGRPGGRVSMRTFREYQKLGGDSQEKKAEITVFDAGGEAIIPGPGPWAKKKVYEKFQKFVINLLKDQKYRRIFSNINFNHSGSEDTFNDSFKWKTILESENSSPEMKSSKKQMGPTIFNLLQDLATPSKCGPDLIDVAIRKYFNQPPPPPKKPQNAASREQNSDTKQVTLEYKNNDPLKISNNNRWCIPAKNKELSSEEEDYIQKDSDSTFNPIKKGHVPIFIDGLDSSVVEPIKVTTISETELTFYPVRLTFSTPLGTNEYFAKNKKTKGFTNYTNLTNREKPKPTLYYGYICYKKGANEGSSFWIFYVKHNGDFKTIDFQCLTIDSANFKNTEEGSALGKDAIEIKLSRLYAFPDYINDKIEKIGASGYDDRSNYQDFFQTEKIGGSGKSFQEFMKKHLDKSDSKNSNRIKTISDKL